MQRGQRHDARRFLFAELSLPSRISAMDIKRVTCSDREEKRILPKNAKQRLSLPCKSEVHIGTCPQGQSILFCIFFAYSAHRSAFAGYGFEEDSVYGMKEKMGGAHLFQRSQSHPWTGLGQRIQHGCCNVHPSVHRNSSIVNSKY